jgi:mono/diheme cytochrome c family protein
VGRTAKPAEVTAWDIDVRPDFKGLPAGQGSVKRGEQVWEAQCASCHGTFGESNDVFTPLTGATTAKDIASGRVASLMPGANATHRTTIMKASQLSSLWDYINRAMPWTAPKSLSADDVYAVVAYLLNLSNVVPATSRCPRPTWPTFKRRMPNRNGITYAHGMWPGQ